jgi:hypothetical protein
MDPYEVLGVRPGAGDREVAAAYRDQAKRWHPDAGGGEEGERRMAELNVAYDLVRLGERHRPARGPRTASPPGTSGGRGSWLAGAVRLALGPELLESLSPGEAVELITPTSTWASPRAVLAVTERRLLWLLDDAVVARVHSLAFRNVADVEQRTRRKRATLVVRTLAGRRHQFHDLRPPTARAIAGLVRPR